MSMQLSLAPSMAAHQMHRLISVRAAPNAVASGMTSLEIYKGVYESPIYEGYWTWQGHRIRYHVSGSEGGDAVVLVHGFGGNADHWRKVSGRMCRWGCERLPKLFSRIYSPGPPGLRHQVSYYNHALIMIKS